MRLNGRANARAEELDLAWSRASTGVAEYWLTRADLDALDGRKREDVDSLDLDRILVALLVDEIEVGQIVEWRQVRRVARPRRWCK